MSDVILTRGPNKATVSRAVNQLRFTGWTETRQLQAAGFHLGLTWVPRPGCRPVYQAPEGDLTVAVLGNLYRRDDEQRLDRDLARLAGEYRRLGYPALCQLNGIGTVVLVDHPADTAYAVTDQSGLYNLFVGAAEAPRRAVVCSHTDVLAAAMDRTPELDRLSVACYATAKSGLFPHTFYQGVRRLDYATVYRWNARGFRKVTRWWQFEPRPNGATREACAETLAEALTAAMRTRQHSIAGPVGVFLSGGLDSRSLLSAAAASGGPVVGITFGDEVNREIRCARALARVADARHVFLRRDPDYYARTAVQAVRMTAGLNEFRHAHSLGFTERLHEMNVGLYVSGDTGDMLFKGAMANCQADRRPPYFLHTERLGPFQRRFWPTRLLSRHEIRNTRLVDAIKQRAGDHYAGLNTTRPSPADWLRIEQRRAFPLGRVTPACFHQILERTLPFDLPFLDYRVLEAYARIPSRLKLNKDLSRRAALKLCPATVAVPDANTGIRVDAHPLQESLTRLMRKLGRAVGLDRHRRADNRLATHESWINWSYYIRTSSLLQSLWAEARDAAQDLMRELVGYDLCGKSREELARDTSLFGRLMTLGLWLKYRIR